jgi:hypothetical protein
VDTLINIAAVFVFFGCLNFVMAYAEVRWWRTPEGINLMSFTCSVMGLAGLRCLAMIFGQGFWGQDLLRFLLMMAIAVIIWHRYRLFSRAQRSVRAAANSPPDA